MSNTRGNLVPAKIYEADENGESVGGVEVACMFNPFEYTVSKRNQYKEEANNRSDAPHMTFKKAGAQTLKLNLFFDTYESGEDVSKATNKMWKFMQPKEPHDGGDKQEPPGCAFQWGVFRFAAVMTSMTQKFTLFKNDGTHVRAKVDVTFTQYNDTNDYPAQNPTSGSDSILRAWQVVRGDRLDLIAANVYGNATKWRQIAEYNHIDNPEALIPGQTIMIPEEA